MIFIVSGVYTKPITNGLNIQANLIPVAIPS